MPGSQSHPSLFPDLQCEHCGADMVDASTDQWIGIKCERGCWGMLSSRKVK